eukprot:g2920.t1
MTPARCLPREQTCRYNSPATKENCTRDAFCQFVPAKEAIRKVEEKCDAVKKCDEVNLDGKSDLEKSMLCPTQQGCKFEDTTCLYIVDCRNFNKNDCLQNSDKCQYTPAVDPVPAMSAQCHPIDFSMCDIPDPTLQSCYDAGRLTLKNADENGQVTKDDGRSACKFVESSPGNGPFPATCEPAPNNCSLYSGDEQRCKNPQNHCQFISIAEQLSNTKEGINSNKQLENKCVPDPLLEECSKVENPTQENCLKENHCQFTEAKAAEPIRPTRAKCSKLPVLNLCESMQANSCRKNPHCVFVPKSNMKVASSKRRLLASDENGVVSDDIPKPDETDDDVPKPDETDDDDSKPDETDDDVPKTNDTDDDDSKPDDTDGNKTEAKKDEAALEEEGTCMEAPQDCATQKNFELCTSENHCLFTKAEAPLGYDAEEFAENYERYENEAKIEAEKYLATLRERIRIMEEDAADDPVYTEQQVALAQSKAQQAKAEKERSDNYASDLASLAEDTAKYLQIVHNGEHEDDERLKEKTVADKKAEEIRKKEREDIDGKSHATAYMNQLALDQEKSMEVNDKKKKTKLRGSQTIQPTAGS